MEDHEEYCVRCRQFYEVTALGGCPGCGYDDEDNADDENNRRIEDEETF